MAERIPGIPSRVAFVIDNEGVEQVELTEPWKAVQEAGGRPSCSRPKPDDVQAFNHSDKGDRSRRPGRGEADPEDYDALVLPGGVVNADNIRTDADAVRFVRHFVEADKPIAVICHGPWILIEAGGLQGRVLTSWPSLSTDVTNAGGEWVDEEVRVDGNLRAAASPTTCRGSAGRCSARSRAGRHAPPPEGQSGSRPEREPSRRDVELDALGRDAGRAGRPVPAHGDAEPGRAHCFRETAAGSSPVTPTVSTAGPGAPTSRSRRCGTARASTPPCGLRTRIHPSDQCTVAGTICSPPMRTGDRSAHPPSAHSSSHDVAIHFPGTPASASCGPGNATSRSSTSGARPVEEPDHRAEAHVARVLDPAGETGNGARSVPTAPRSRARPGWRRCAGPSRTHGCTARPCSAGRRGTAHRCCATRRRGARRRARRTPARATRPARGARRRGPRRRRSASCTRRAHRRPGSAGRPRAPTPHPRAARLSAASNHACMIAMFE